MLQPFNCHFWSFLSKNGQFGAKNRHFLVEMISFGIPETEIKIIILPTYLQKLQTLSALENVVLINENGHKMTLFDEKGPYLA